MSKSISELILLFAFFWCVVSSSQQHLVCKTIEDVFTEDGLAENQPRYRGVQGPPGKVGPKGERGNRGLPGTEGGPGRVDHDRVNDVIDQKVANDDCRRRGGLVYSGKCFTVPHMSSSRDMNYDQAVAECTKHGSLLAEIHDRAQQNALYDFARTRMPAGSVHVQVWLGAEYKQSTSTVLYRSGMETLSNQFQWRPGYPNSLSSWKHMAMAIRNDGGDDFGLWKFLKSYSLHGVMCEKVT